MRSQLHQHDPASNTEVSAENENDTGIFRSPLHERLFRGLDSIRRALGLTISELSERGAFRSTNQWTKWQRGSTFELVSIERVAQALGAHVHLSVSHPNHIGGVVVAGDADRVPLATPEARLVALIVDTELDAQGRADVLSAGPELRDHGEPRASRRFAAPPQVAFKLSTLKC
jgi:hypothetical protein